MQNNLINWLALQRTNNIGPIKFQNYLKSDPYLHNLPDIAKSTLNEHRKSIYAHLDWASRENCHIVLFCDEDYPNILKNIPDPPPVLFIKGNKELLNRPQLAIVGSRNASKLGIEIAYKFAQELVKFKLVITSGLALGIDASSHKGAMQSGKESTIAVLGNGLDVIYPKKHLWLTEQIIYNGGALISEFPLGTQPLPINFPRRNRIISGLSLGILVIEASINSGSLITADYAIEQGREVFVIPGSIYDQNVKGCHKLIKQGATLVEGVEDIVGDLGFTKCHNKLEYVAKDFNRINCLDDLQKKILTSISYETTATDTIIDRTGLMANIVNSGLVSLELLGHITSVPGGYIRLI